MKSRRSRWSAIAVSLGATAVVQTDLELLTTALAAEARSGDQLVLMSNGSFGGLHERLLAALRARAAPVHR